METARLAALSAGHIIRRDIIGPRNVRFKSGPRDLVTDTDYAAQAAALEVIAGRHADHPILAEENPGSRPDANGVWTLPAGPIWMVDPLDGTTNFAAGLPFVCTSVGVAIDGQPVAGAIYDPLRDEMFLGALGLGAALNGRALGPVQSTAIGGSVIGVDWAHSPRNREQVVQTVLALATHCRALRSLGSAALALAYVAVGRVHLYANFGLKPWDTAAAAAILSETGAAVQQLDGRAWHPGEPRVMAAHPDLLAEALRLLSKP